VALGAGAINALYLQSGRQGDHGFVGGAINHQHLADLLHRRRAGGRADFRQPGATGIRLVTGALILISSCAASPRSISFSTAAVSPLLPIMTTGWRLCASPLRYCCCAGVSDFMRIPSTEGGL